MPSEEQIQRALELIAKPGSGHNYVHFFTRLEDPAWLEPLRAAGYFRQPPEPQQAEGGWIFPGWPESSYLERVADRAPAEVAAIVREIPTSENPRVQADLARIAARLPARAAAQNADRILKWLEGRHHLAVDLPEALGELVIHLATVGKRSETVDLMRALIAVRAEPGTEESWRARVEPRMDAWSYKGLLERLVPETQGALGLDALAAVAEALDQALRLTSREPPQDMSGIWRPSIASEPEIHEDDPREQLISGLRDAALAESNDRDSLGAVLDELRKHDWVTFRRVELHLLAQKATLDVSTATAGVFERAALESGDATVEYTELVAALAPHLSDDQRGDWLALVDEGPGWPPRNADEREAKGISEEDYAGYVGVWRRDRYSQLREQLDSQQAEVLARLEDEYGTAQAETANAQSGYWTGPTSPLSDDQLLEMTAVAIVEYLGTWEPSSDPMTPSPEGLARRIAERIGADPAPFAEVAEDMRQLDPTYVRAALQGFEMAVTNELSFDWGPVAALIEAATDAQAVDEPEGSGDRGFLDADPGRSWSRGASASLLTKALAADALPPELGERMWRVIETLSWDPEPTPEYEAKYGAENMDPLTLSLNTTRGKAMHAVIAFGVWSRRQSTGAAEWTDDVALVLENLTAHLDPEREVSQTVRGVLGARLNQLLWLDGEWLEAHLVQLFPRDEEHEALGRAVWESYLSYGGGLVALFPLLKEEYRLAIGELPTQADQRSRTGRDPGLVLAEHLGVLCYQGIIGLEAGGLLDEFFAAASTGEQAHLIEFVGRSFSQAEDEVPDEVLQRVVALWEWISAKLEGDEHRGEILAGFGWWYTADVFDRSWRDREILSLLRDGVPVGPEFAVARTLATPPPDGMGRMLEILHLFVQHERAAWRLLGVQDELRAALSQAVSASSEEREKARQTIDLLTAKGVGVFADLLGAQPPQAT